MTLDLLRSSLRVHQKFRLSQCGVSKLIAVIVSIISWLIFEQSAAAISLNKSIFGVADTSCEHSIDASHIDVVSRKAFYQKGHCNTCLTL